MSEKQTMKDEETEKSSEPTLDVEDLDVTDAEDVKGGSPKPKPIEIESW
jgi:hypothetical protein